MRSIVRFDRLLLAAALAAVAVLGLAQTVHAGPTAPEAPSTIAVEEGHKPFFVADAVGVQIYACTTDGAGFRWSLVAPRADLYDQDGRFFGTHSGGPTWQAKDGSLVKAALDGRVTVDPTAIDWFRLRVTHRAAGADGDRLGATTFIQRVQTVDGLAPARTCDAESLGDVEEVPYTAVYVFWKATGS
jgi:Protein of unknown function (DUF3455)